MPNHVSHKLQFINEAAQTLYMEIKMRPQRKGVSGDFDFDMFVPLKRGSDWYNEAIAKHGTKWGAYDCSDFYEEDGVPTVRFDTAWSTAEPVWYAIAEQYPEVEILIHYADEDTGNNLGVICIVDGELLFNEQSDAPTEDKAVTLNKIYGSAEFVVCEKDPERLCSLEWAEDDDEEDCCTSCTLLKEYKKE